MPRSLQSSYLHLFLILIIKIDLQIVCSCGFSIRYVQLGFSAFSCIRPHWAYEIRKARIGVYLSSLYCGMKVRVDHLQETDSVFEFCRNCRIFVMYHDCALLKLEKLKWVYSSKDKWTVHGEMKRYCFLDEMWPDCYKCHIRRAPWRKIQ